MGTFRKKKRNHKDHRKKKKEKKQKNKTTKIKPKQITEIQTSYRQTKHTLLETTSGEYFIISSLSTRRDTQVITIDPYTGSLHYFARQGVDLFKSETQAIDTLFKEHRTLKRKTSGCAIIGYTIISSIAYLVLVTKAETTVSLFGSHEIKTIESVEWIKLTLAYQYPNNKNEQKNIEIMPDFPIDGLHFYCESLDITKPFPSHSLIEDYNPDFCWNKWLKEPFEQIGLSGWCIVLLQGIAVGRNLQNQDLFNMFLITRKTHLNPGTRYHARGLNEFGEAGNEMECELVSWIEENKTKKNEDLDQDQDQDQNQDQEEEIYSKITWISHIWRRGTVPVRWGTTLKTKVSEPEIVIKSDPYRGTDQYYTRLIERFGKIPIVCFNMLKCIPGNAETTLTEAFQESHQYVQSLMDIDLKLINFDWHSNIKQLGKDETITGLWLMLKPILSSQDLNGGFITTSFKKPKNEHFIPFDRKEFGIINQTSFQQGVTRYNCADSLDRTNVATFFMVHQIISEMCFRLQRGTVNYQIEKNWQLFDVNLENFRKIINSSVLEAIAEFFVTNGDVCSILYTNSPAMHTAMIREYSPSLSSAPNNTIIVLKRRYQNVQHDRFRQVLYELFLGKNREKYFPSTRANPIERVSGYPTWCLKNIEFEKILPRIESENLPERLLSDTSVSWICPKEKLKSELFLFLKQPCYLTEICFTIRGGVNDSNSPVFADIFVGNYLDKMRIIAHRMPIPICNDGNKICYKLVQNRNEEYNLFDFEGNSLDFGMLSRIILVTFHGNNAKLQMVLGKVDVFGVPPRSVTQAFQKIDFKIDLNQLFEEQIQKMFPQQNTKKIDNEELFIDASNRHTISNQNFVDATTFNITEKISNLKEKDSNLDFKIYDNYIDRFRLMNTRSEYSIKRSISFSRMKPQKKLVPKHSVNTQKIRRSSSSKFNDQLDILSNKNYSKNIKSPSRRRHKREHHHQKEKNKENQSIEKKEDKIKQNENRNEEKNPNNNNNDNEDYDQVRSINISNNIEEDLLIFDDEDKSDIFSNIISPITLEESQAQSKQKINPDEDLISFDEIETFKGNEMNQQKSLIEINSNEINNENEINPNEINSNEINNENEINSNQMNLQKSLIEINPNETNETNEINSNQINSNQINEINDENEKKSNKIHTKRRKKERINSSQLSSPKSPRSPKSPKSPKSPRSQRSETHRKKNKHSKIKSELSLNKSKLEKQEQEISICDSIHEVQQEYYEAVQSLISRIRSNETNLNFLETLQLELLRFELGLTTFDRDYILLKLGCRIQDFNPHRFIFPRDEKMFQAIMKSKKFYTNTCSNPSCGARLRLSKYQCRYCLNKFCYKCMSVQAIKIIEYMWEKPVPVCKSCAYSLTKQKTIIDKIRKLEIQQKNYLLNLHIRQMQQIFKAISVTNSLKKIRWSSRTTTKITNSAVFPQAGILRSVPTDPLFSSIESIIFPENIEADPWFAPPSCSSVNVTIVLSSESFLDNLTINTDSFGYSFQDAPKITIFGGLFADDLKFIGVWDLREIEEKSNDNNIDNDQENIEEKNDSKKENLEKTQNQTDFDSIHSEKVKEFSSRYQNENSKKIIKPNSKLIYKLNEKERCRIISMNFELQENQSDENLENENLENENLEKENENEFFQHKSFNQTNLDFQFQDLIRLHLGRISINGISKFSPQLPVTTESISIVISRQIEAIELAEKQQIPAIWYQYRPIKRIIDIGFETTPIRGFILHIIYDDEEGFSSQPQSLILTIFETDKNGDIVSQLMAGKFLIPKTKSGVMLLYNLEHSVVGNRVTFEILNNYGGRNFSAGKITLF
ncbi:phosphoinositide phosphatase sac9-related [Anaeramoeba ignava]|uniref:Phosphoinositide phosphatase sac9-related n=1 Tax=Anaeramoeba ignava TaxID=1746090 RepID=A0A9Q0R5U3_ANAIG|nr:phosphoinositide phosphatase sac9-related [Anaeramoeba ignava]